MQKHNNGRWNQFVKMVCFVIICIVIIIITMRCKCLPIIIIGTTALLHRYSSKLNVKCYQVTNTSFLRYIFYNIYWCYYYHRHIINLLECTISWMPFPNDILNPLVTQTLASLQKQTTRFYLKLYVQFPLRICKVQRCSISRLRFSHYWLSIGQNKFKSAQTSCIVSHILNWLSITWYKLIWVGCMLVNDKRPTWIAELLMGL